MSISYTARQRERSSDILKGSTAAVCGFDIFVNKPPCFHTCCNDQLSITVPLPRAEDDERNLRLALPGEQRPSALRRVYLFSPQLAAARRTVRMVGRRARRGWQRRFGAPSQLNPTVTGVLLCCCCFSSVSIWMLHMVFLPPPGKQRVRLVHQKDVLWSEGTSCFLLDLPFLVFLWIWSDIWRKLPTAPSGKPPANL